MTDVRLYLNPQGNWSNSTVYKANNVAAQTFDGVIVVSAPTVNYTDGIIYYYPLSTPSTAGVTPPTGGSGWIAFGATATSGAGTVTSVSVVSANGLAGTVATATTTPAITLSCSANGILQSNGTTISAATTVGTGNIALTANSATTYVPTITAATPGDLAVTYSTQTGFYYQIGRMVFATFNIVTSAFTYTTASGNLIISLPVAVNATAGLTNRGSLAFQGITKASYTNFVVEAQTSTSTAFIKASGSAQTLATLAITDLPTGGSVILDGSVTYSI